MIKRIISVFLLASILCFLLVSNYGVVTFEKSDLTATNREITSDLNIILDSDVALAGSLQASGFGNVLKQINDYRKSQGLNELEWNSSLEAAAAIRAEECTTLWSHTRPNGQEWWTVDPSILYGENLSKGYSNEEVVDAWKASPSHNANLLTKEFKYIGLASYEGYIACEFCY